MKNFSQILREKHLVEFNCRTEIFIWGKNMISKEVAISWVHQAQFWPPNLLHCLFGRKACVMPTSPSQPSYCGLWEAKIFVIAWTVRAVRDSDSPSQRVAPNTKQTIKTTVQITIKEKQLKEIFCFPSVDNVYIRDTKDTKTALTFWWEITWVFCFSYLLRGWIENCIFLSGIRLFCWAKDSMNRGWCLSTRTRRLMDMERFVKPSSVHTLEVIL